MRSTVFAALLLAPLAAAAEEAPAPDAESRLKALESRLEKLEGAPAKASLSSFNPAIGMALDFAYSQAHDKGNFAFRAAELNVEAPIDPFLKGWGIITGSNSGVDIEEAALETTSLPCSLTARGGRLFADFGRMAHFHDHELPVIDRPRSLDAYVGGETQADGVELSWLAPTSTFLNATVGMYNKMGADNVDRATNDVPRNPNKFTYLGRLSTSVELGDDHSIDLGVSSAWTPRRTVVEDIAATGRAVAEVTKKNTWRTLHGADLTYRWQPATGGLYKGALWGTEVLQNDDRRFKNGLPTDRVKAWAGYSFVQLKLGRHWRPGAMLDVTEDIDRARRNTKTLTAFLTYDVTEFQRLRASYSRVTDNVPGSLHNDVVGIQWTGVLGHHVHGFRDR